MTRKLPLFPPNAPPPGLRTGAESDREIHGK